MARAPARAAARDVIAAVLVNYAGTDDTIACVESLLAAAPRPDAVVVVDNASPDGSADRLERWIAERLSPGDGAAITLVRERVNRGFGPGINAGWRAARQLPGLEHVLIINNDAVVAPGFLPPLTAELADPAVGAVAGTILHAGPGNGVWYAGGEFRWWQCRGAHETVPSPAPRDVTFCTGCMVLVRAAAMDAVQGMPEPYFLYYEDVEFSVRLMAAGWRLRYAPASVVHHTVGSAAGQRRERALIAFVSARNRFWLARRNLPPGKRVVATLNVLADETGRALGALGRGRLRVAAAIARGVTTGLVMSPGRS